MDIYDIWTWFPMAVSGFWPDPQNTSGESPSSNNYFFGLELHSNDLEAFTKKCFGSIRKPNIWRVLAYFWTWSFWHILSTFYEYSCGLLSNYHQLCVVYMWNNFCIQVLAIFWILRIFIFIWLKGMRVALMHVYVWEHMFRIIYRITGSMFKKFGRNEVRMVSHMYTWLSARSPKGLVQGWAKIGHGGVPSLTNVFFRPNGFINKVFA